jgi:hypothetical protein
MIALVSDISPFSFRQGGNTGHGFHERGQIVPPVLERRRDGRPLRGSPRMDFHLEVLESGVKGLGFLLFHCFHSGIEPESERLVPE